MASQTSSSRIFVRNLPLSISDDQFRAHFAKNGETTDSKLLRNRRMGFVGYKSPEDANAAVKYFNRTFIGMARIAVEIAQPYAEEQSKPKQAIVPKGSTESSKTLKRKREVPDENTDPKLREFLGVMQSTAKSKTWQNEVAVDDNDTTMAVDKVNESDDDVQVLPSKTKQQQQSIDAIFESDSNEDTDPTAEAKPITQSDKDWLRSKKGKLLDEDAIPQEKDQELAEQVTAGDAGDEPEDVEMQDEDIDESPEVFKIRQSGRLFLRNLSFKITEDELREGFSQFGDLEEGHPMLLAYEVNSGKVHVPSDKTGSSKGIAFLLFDDPESAVAAYQTLDGKTFQGRLIHILPADPKRESKLDDYAISKLPLKQQQKIKQKMESNLASYKWNSLYMNMDDVMSSIATRLGVEKSQLLDPTSSDAAVKQAIAETNVIQDVKSYFVENGVSLDKFKPGKQRGDTAILIKNLPHGTSPDEIREVFSAHGRISRLLIPRSGTIALIEFGSAPEGRAAFQALKYKRFKNTILFLEKAPKNVFDKPAQGSVVVPAKADGIKAKLTTSDLLEEAPNVEAIETSTLFVRNLNFTTTSEKLRDTFSPLSGFVSARVKTRTDSKRPGEILSMGFGFVEFKSKSEAQSAIATMNGHFLEGHTLTLQPSQRVLDAGEDRRKQDKAKAIASQQTKVIVKNLPFEASKKDVRALLGTYGQLRSVRVPKKFDSSARGFAFAEFTTAREAANAMAALKSTHLLGRRLHLEYAAQDTLDPEDAIEKMQKKVGSQVDKVALQKLTGAGRKKFNVSGNEPTEPDG
ncbi:putative pre-rRNA processing protein Mrd1 [Microthyrium microscopicum]|uniref:Multiple RNA-binding domain-containing protein 1 n=1 Tax=Microthyrium microscopicum TaxID=703497 RepID=A0A6A6U5D2_9PEZI|nr:putative pre-rRNA processing protein Mrd1 [Microthyrium microscopicum]